MDWTWGYDLPITLVTMVPFWFLFILLQARFTFKERMRDVEGIDDKPRWISPIGQILSDVHMYDATINAA